MNEAAPLNVRAALPRKSGLCVAIDDEDAARAVALASAVRGTADVLKVGYPSVLSAGLRLIGELRRAGGAPVICDFKIADIPPISARIARLAVEAGAAGVIAHAFAGRDTLAAVVEAAHGRGAAAFAVVEMSHEGGREFTQPNADALFEAAVACGVDGIVAPATRPERIAHFRQRSPGMLLLSPGAGAQGGSPGAAARAGADFVIVGRSITGSPDPAAAARAAAADIAKGRPA